MGLWQESHPRTLEMGAGSLGIPDIREVLKWQL